MEYICIGKIVNTHGIKGELKISSYSDFDRERYQKGNTVYVRFEGNYLPFTVKTYRTHKGHALVSFENHLDINLVEKYKTCEVYISRVDRKPLQNGKYYRDEIVGLEAYDQNQTLLGTVASIEETLGAQNNIRIRKEDGSSFLVPFVPAFIQNVDLENHAIYIQMQEGLL